MPRTILHHWRRVERRITGQSYWSCMKTGLALSFVLWVLAGWMVGVVNGASIALEGSSLTAGLLELNGLQGEIRADFIQAHPLALATYLLMDWAVSLLLAATILGMHIGYAAPVTASILKYTGDVILVFIVFAVFLNLVKVVYIAYLEVKR